MNSIERVKAALNFEGPDKVPIWKLGRQEGDVFTMIRIPSKKWQPGHHENEKGLFPHPNIDFIIHTNLWTWDKPNWAIDPKYKKFRRITRYIFQSKNI